MPRSPITLTLAPGERYVDNLERRLVQLGVSHNGLARAIGVAPSVVSRWMNRPNMTPSMKNIERIERVLQEIQQDRAKLERAFLDGLAAGVRWSGAGNASRRIADADWQRDRLSICEDEHEAAEIERLVRQRFNPATT